MTPPPPPNSKKAEECEEHCGSLMFPESIHNGPYRWQPSNPFITIPKYGDFQGNSESPPSPHTHTPQDPQTKGKNVVSRTDLSPPPAWSGRKHLQTQPAQSPSLNAPPEPGFRQEITLDSGTAVSSHQSLVLNVSLMCSHTHRHTHTFEPRSCTKRAKRLP